MPSAFHENVRGRVLNLATISYDAAGAHAREVFDARVEALIACRKVNEAEVVALAANFRKQFPKLVGTGTPARSRSPVDHSKTRSQPPPRGNAQTPVLSPSAAVPKPSGATRSKKASLPSAGDEGSSAKPQSPIQGPPGRKAAVQQLRASALTPAPVVSRGDSGGAGGRHTSSPTSPQRVSVQRRLQESAADAEFVRAMQAEMAQFAEEERRKAEAKADAREQMRRFMNEHAKVVAEREEAARQERRKNREEVIQAMEDVKLDEAIDRERRRAKFAREKQEIERQKEARRKAKEAEEAREAAENAKFRKEVVEGIHLDDSISKQRFVETRQALVEYLNESKVALEEKRRQQQQERDRVNRESLQRASPFLPGASATDDRAKGSRLPGMNEQQAQKLAARDHAQRAVMATHAARAEARKAQDDAAERAAMAAERRTADEMVRRNEAEVAKARNMRSALVESLDQELSIHRDRVAAAEEERRRLRVAADKEAAEMQEARAAAAAEAKKRQAALRESLAAQIDEKERNAAAAAQRIKINQRDRHFLPKPVSS